ncbi:MAG: hypothetical protein M1528_00105 [Candidatus Marsarchaeota archaeon]|nr:hypothetical protein [Candidatus Marsarchaeota archaeon]
MTRKTEKAQASEKILSYDEVFEKLDRELEIHLSYIASNPYNIRISPTMEEQVEAVRAFCADLKNARGVCIRTMPIEEDGYGHDFGRPAIKILTKNGKKLISYGGPEGNGFDALAFMREFSKKPEEGMARLSEIMPPAFEPNFTLKQMRQRSSIKKHKWGSNQTVAHLLAYDEHYVTRIMAMGMDVLRFADNEGETVAHVIARHYPKTYGLEMAFSYPKTLGLRAKNGTSVGWIVYANADEKGRELLRKKTDIVDVRTFGDLRIATALKLEELLRLADADSQKTAAGLNKYITETLLLRYVGETRKKASAEAAPRGPQRNNAF